MNKESFSKFIQPDRFVEPNNAFADVEHGPSRRIPEIRSLSPESSLVDRRLAEYRALRDDYHAKYPNAQNCPFDEIVEGLESGTIIPQN